MLAIHGDWLEFLQLDRHGSACCDGRLISRMQGQYELALGGQGLKHMNDGRLLLSCWKDTADLGAAMRQAVEIDSRFNIGAETAKQLKCLKREMSRMID